MAEALHPDGKARRRGGRPIHGAPTDPALGRGKRSSVRPEPRGGRQRSWETPEGDKRSVTEIEADEVGASLKWATAKVERAVDRGNGDRAQGRERQVERGGDFNEPPPF